MFAVVIPLYNKAPHIETTLRSVLAQKMSPAEIIVVDDGSTDGGDRIVEPFASQGITLIRQSNSGVSAARNTGVAAARSPFVAFLDADDEWLPTHLATLAQAIERFPDVGLYSTMHSVHVSGRNFTHHSAYPSGFIGKVDGFFTYVLAGPALIHTSAACVKRNAFLDVGGFPVGLRYYEDFTLWIKMAVNFGMVHAAIVTATYNCDSVNRSTQLRGREKIQFFDFLQEVIASGKLSTKERLSAMLFRDKTAFNVAAAMRLSNDIHGLTALREFALESRLHKLTIKLGLLAHTPTFLLELARRARHSSRTTSLR